MKFYVENLFLLILRAQTLVNFGQRWLHLRRPSVIVILFVVLKKTCVQRGGVLHFLKNRKKAHIDFLEVF